MITRLHIYIVVLSFPNIAFAAKPESISDRVGATIFMVLLVAFIGLIWVTIKYIANRMSTKSMHEAYPYEKSPTLNSSSSPYDTSAEKKRYEKAGTDLALKDYNLQNPPSRSALSLEEAVLGHWVSYIDYRTSYEKLKRSKHYIATHWYINKDNLSIIQIETKGHISIQKTARKFIFNILERNDVHNTIKYEMYDGPQKSSYSQGTITFNQDGHRIKQNTVLPNISETTEWIYVSKDTPEVTQK